MLRTAFFLLLFSSLLHTSYGQISWQALNGPAGTEGVKVLGIDQTGRIFIAAGAGIYTSTNEGDSWMQSDAGLSTVQIAQIAGLTIFPSGKTGALIDQQYYTFDAGTLSWQVDVTLKDVGAIWIDQEGHFWKKIGIDLHHASGEGQPFSLVLPGIYQTGPGCCTQVANFNDGNNLYAQNFSEHATLKVFNRSGTVTHTKTQANPIYFIGYNNCSGTAFYSDLAKNYRSTDGGITWNTISFGIYTAITSLHCVNNQEIWAVTTKGVYRSTDDGQTWNVAPSADAEAHLYVGSNGVVYIKDDCSGLPFSKTSDGGNSWTNIEVGFMAPNIQEVYTAKNGTLYAHGCDSYEMSINDGQTWSTSFLFDSLTLPMNNLVVHPDGSLFTLLVATRHLITSKDGGNTWNLVQTPINFNGWAAARLASDRLGNLYLFGNQNTCYRSDNQGLNWTSVNNQYVPLDPSVPIWILNNGDYFRPWSNGLIYFNAATQNKTNEILSFASGNEVVKTLLFTASSMQSDFYIDGFTNSGKPFVARYAGNGKIEPFDNFPGLNPGPMTVSNSGVLFVVSNDTLYSSPNSGADWVFAGLLPYPYAGAQSLQSIQICNDQHLYIGYYGHPIYKSAQILETNFTRVEGIVWLDENNDCIRTPNEPTLGNSLVQATGNLEIRAYSDAVGAYHLYLPAGTGAYTVMAAPRNALLNTSCSVQLNIGATNDTLFRDLALLPTTQCPYLKVHVGTALVRRCSTAVYTLSYSNEGTTLAPNATITVTLDSFFTFQYASIPPLTQNGQDLTFSLGDLPAGKSGSIQIHVAVGCNAPFGQSHCVKAQIFPFENCLGGLPDLSTATDCRQNVGSYDPNAIHAWVYQQIDPPEIEANTAIEYQINFQNTGTDTAFTVEIVDRISSLLDLNTLTPLASSHPYELRIQPDRTLVFTFSNILLPDSNINEAASHGFVRFGINQLANLYSGLVIENTAQIYFDQNDPVATNTSRLEIELIVHVQEPLPGYQVRVYPNPFSDHLTFHIDASDVPQQYQLVLTDVLGREIRQVQFEGSTLQLACDGIGHGIYFFAIRSTQGALIATGKLLAE